MTDDTEQLLQGLGYTSNGNLHVIPKDSKEGFDKRIREKRAAFCGALFPRKNLQVEGNIGWFMDGGELVGEAKHSSNMEADQ